MASHTKSLSQLVQPNPKIIAAQTIIPNIGTSGTNGVLNCLGNSGFVFLKMITAAHTRINANKVPMLVMSPTISPGTNAAKAPTNIKMIKLAL